VGLIIDDDDVEYDDVGAEVVEEIVVVDAIDVTAILLSVEGFVMLVVDGVAFVALIMSFFNFSDDCNFSEPKYDEVSSLNWSRIILSPSMIRSLGVIFCNVVIVFCRPGNEEGS